MPEASPAPRYHEPDQKRLREVGAQVRATLDANPAAQRIATDKAEIWAVGRFFDAEECRRLIAIIDAGAQPSVAYGVPDSSDIRTSSTTYMDPHNLFVRGLERRIDGLLGIDPAFGETSQGQRYRPGEEFKPHVDWFPPGSSDGDLERARGGQRSFTAMVFLNKVEEGGETDFPYLDLAIHPRRGTLLAWNNVNPDGTPNSWTTHAGNPVIRGVKYIVTRWYRARPWG